MTFDVTIVAEDGLPHELATSTRDRIASDLESILDDQVDLAVLAGSLSLDEDGNVHLSDSVTQSGSSSRIIVFITELPRLWRGDPTPVEIDTTRSAGIVSVPACGAFALRRRVSKLVVAAVAGLTQTDQGNEASRMVENRRRRWQDNADRPGKSTLLAATRLGWTQQVLGMARVNRPWRLVSTLKGVMAAAAATASFGIFYASIWSMSAAMSTWRLAMVTVLSVVVMTAWLIIANKLWESQKQRAYGKMWARLYNASTVLTVLVGVLAMYVCLYVLALFAGLIVIDWGFMSKQLPKPATLANFVLLAWLTTSMGVIAGALGSSADSYDAILRATYGSRERERRMAEEDQADDENSDSDGDEGSHDSARDEDSQDSARDEDSRDSDREDSADDDSEREVRATQDRVREGAVEFESDKD